jgi:DNA (cytosine-5)-methyltransferase 1
MKVLDLFSGIGGFSLGLEWAGMETIAMCEKDKFCRQVLAKHWPDITIHEDIRDLDGKDYKGSIDVVCGGFPCQPFSVAGKQLGKADDRHLWPEMLRVIKESAPTWVIGENVSGFVGMALDDVCLDLEAEGYEVQSFVIPACAVEAHHKRDRCWIVAHANELRLEEHGHRESTQPVQAGQRPHLVADTHPSRKLQPQGSEQEVRRRTGDSREDVADSESERIQRLWSSREQKPYAYGPALVPLCEGEGLGSTYWEAEPDVDRVVDGLPNRVDRIRSLGNAVVPQLVQRIGELVYAEHHRSARD